MTEDSTQLSGLESLLRQGRWTHDPIAAAFQGGRLTATAAEGSDAWRHTAYGFVHDSEHGLLAPMPAEAAVEVGAKEAFLIEEPMAAAIGANLNVEEPRGKMVVDIGGGTTDIAVISLGGIVVSKSLRIGGDRLDEGIVRYLRKQYNLAVGEQTSENLKIMIGTCLQEDPDTKMILKGRDLLQGLPRQIEVSSLNVSMAIGEMVQALIDGVRNVLELTPPELSADIIDRGIVLTGGGALLRGLTELITRQTGINCFTADDPMECVALGTGKALAEIDKLQASGRSGILVNRRKGRKKKL